MNRNGRAYQPVVRVVGPRIRAKPAPRHPEAPALRGAFGKVAHNGRKRPGGVDGAEQQPAEPLSPADECNDAFTYVVIEQMPQGLYFRLS